MDTLTLAQNKVPMRRVGSEWHGPCPSCGAGKSGDAHTDRFSVKANGRWFCRSCTPRGGDAVTFLRTFEGKSCPVAHVELGLVCSSSTCPARDKCPQGDGRNTAPRVKSLRAPETATPAAFVPAAVLPPAELWCQAAEKLIEVCHAELLANPEQLAYLAGRGLPLAAVEKYRLGWIAEDLYRPRTAWGLPEERWENGKPKKLKIHRGILIPTYTDGRPHRLRIRRPKNEIKEGAPSYLEVSGSGNDRVILNPEARAVVVVESDLDALLLDWAVGDLVGALPTVSASAKPKESTWHILQRALCILVASDIEPVWDEAKQRWVNVGGSSAQWWLQQFPRAKRWPVPKGKDPGEFFQDYGGDLRDWILAGLPPVFHLPMPAAPIAPEKQDNTPLPLVDANGGGGVAPAEPAEAYVIAKHPSGRQFVMVETRKAWREACEALPGVAVVGMREAEKVDPAAAEFVLAVKSIFGAVEVVSTNYL